MKKTNSFPSDAAICFSTTGANAFAASFASNGDVEVLKFDGGGSFHLALKEWRARLGHLTDLQTVFRFIPLQFTEQTHIAALPEEARSLDDNELTVWLIDAASRQMSGEDGQPLFESGLEKSAYDYARLPDGNISLTEVPRERLHEALKQLMQSQPLDSSDLTSLTRYVSDDTQPHLLHAVETRLRSITRYIANRDQELFSAVGDDETIAVFAFTTEGCGFSLWNPARAFYAEYGEWFNLNFDENEIPEDMNRADYVAQLYMDSVYNFMHEQFYKRVVPEDIDASPVKINRIYWTANDGLENPLTDLLAEFKGQTNLSFAAMGEIPQEEMIVRGLLLAHDGEAEARVPSINLANDISVQNDSINAEVLNLKAVADRSKRQVVLACLTLPVIIAFGAVMGLWFNNQRIAASLAWREANAKSEQNRLQPVLQARADYEKTLKWYEDVLRQIIALRQKQTSSLSFAARLDPLYPQTGAFYISDLKLAPGGVFELKGFTRDETEVSQFVQAMEFAQDEKEARYFTGLQLEFKQGSKLAGATSASTAGSTIGGNLAPGVSGFVLKGNFAPAAVLKPQTPSAPTAAPTTNPAAPNQAVPNAPANNPTVPPSSPNADSGSKK